MSETLRSEIREASHVLLAPWGSILAVSLKLDLHTLSESWGALPCVVQCDSCRVACRAFAGDKAVLDTHCIKRGEPSCIALRLET